MKEFVISKQNEGQRFDKYLFRIIGNGGMSFIFKMLRKKNFVLNDKKATGKEILKAGDIIKLYISDDTFDKFKSDIKNDVNIDKDKNIFDLKENIVYEDGDILLINKPINILSQKANKNDISINEYIIDYLINKNEITNESLIDYKPSAINRLDRNTTGIILACKNLKSARVLSESLRDRTIKKYYKCIVDGEFNINGNYEGFITKDSVTNKVTITDKKLNEESSLIKTEYKLLEYNGKSTLLEVHLITGKPHQIRAHLSYLGFPILGDSKYGNVRLNKELNLKSQMLHSYKLVFPNYDEKYNFKFAGKTFICEPDFKLERR